MNSIHSLGVAMVSNTEQPRQAFLVLGNNDKMNMVWHKTVCENVHTCFRFEVSQQSQVRFEVGIVEECPLSTNSTLSDVVWVAGHYKTREFWQMSLLD